MEKHNDDALSVSAWVEEFMTKGEENPFLLYKPQGQPSSNNCLELSSDDFILIIQTPLQREVFKKCATNNCVCVDATHKTNGYDFPLITVVVVDEFGEGYPVAWCISNREDTRTLKIFFEKLKEICGDLKTSWLMTDMAEQYYIVWSAVFGPTKKILCTWHVDRAWRGHLTFIQSKEVQTTIYHSLRVLLDGTDCGTFELLL